MFGAWLSVVNFTLICFGGCGFVYLTMVAVSKVYLFGTVSEEGGGVSMWKLATEPKCRISKVVDIKSLGLFHLVPILSDFGPNLTFWSLTATVNLEWTASK